MIVLSIIDDVKGKVVSNIETGPTPFGIGIDTIKNRAYVTTDSGIDIIDYMTNFERNVTTTLYNTIPMSYIPAGIVINANTSRAYVANSGANTVSVIDTMSNMPLYEIEVGLFPFSIAFNPTNKMVYVSNTGENTISLIDSTIKKELINLTKNKIPIDSSSYDIAVNPKTNIIYTANSESQTISTLNGTANKPISSLKFHVYPSEGGYIES